MSIASDFFNSFFDFLNTLPSWEMSIVLVIVLLIVLLSSQIKAMFNCFWKNFINKKRRSCGDCILLIFGISEKYKREIYIIEHRILELQMNYVEQKIETFTLDLLRTYKEDQFKILQEKGMNISEEILEREYINYKEALANAIELAKKEIRRSFKENGFDKKNGKEFADFVKEKAKDLLAIGRKYMLNSYYKNSVVSLERRFNNFDERAFEDLIFEVYIKAKEIRTTSENMINNLNEKFKLEIDNFIKDKG